MASTHRLNATFTQSLGKEFPSIPALKSMIFFGTGYDGNEGNRVSGGPAPTVLQGTPVHSTNFVTVGFQSGPSRNDVIDMNLPRDSSWVTSGWTGMAVARNVVGGGNYNDIISDQNSSSASPGQAGSVMGMGMQAGNNRLILFVNGIANRGNIQFTTSVANWKIVGFTSPAGGLLGATFSIWEFTENQAGQSASAALIANITGIPVPAMSPHFGAHSVESSVGQGSIDVAWGMIAQTVLTQSAMAAIASSVRLWLGRRGIVC